MNSSPPSEHAMNPATPPPSPVAGQILSPIPANFDRWPKPMQDRYRRHTLAAPPIPIPNS